MLIKEVQSRKQFRDFLNLPNSIYSAYPKYVRPLNLHLKLMIGNLKSKEKHLLLAYKDNKPVARLGIKTHTHNQKKYLHFGFFECVQNHPEAAKKLFEHARSLYPDLVIKGPFHFRMEDPYVGSLVEGFDKDPYFLMPYNPPYYDEYLISAGLSKAMDLFTYEVDSAIGIGEAILNGVQKANENNITLRTLNKKKLREEATSIAKIFNDALSRNWGYEEFTKEQVDEMVTLLRLFIDPRVVSFAQKDGKDVGCLLMIPNYNPIIKPFKGKLTPGLIFNFLRKKNRCGNIRGYALGVLKEYHGLGIGSLLVDGMFKTAPQYGYKYGEVSWVLANNGPMNELSQAMNGKHNKIYRIYESTPNL